MSSEPYKSMKLKLYQIDAFAQTVFEGNPAAVVPLDEWLNDSLMQRIAMENNLSETAFLVPVGDKWHIRWFTPTDEVDMCGHATLASAFVLYKCMGFQGDEVVFTSRSGDLRVRKDGNLYVMNFPIQAIEVCELPTQIANAFEITPIECYRSMDYILVFKNESDVVSAIPKLEYLYDIDARGVIITAPGNDYDFVCRFFAPKVGVNEDPVTGSAFTQLVPYWNRVSSQTTFKAKQISSRGGEIYCMLKSDRVEIAGYAIKYLEGSIEL